jgi:hypothetical protein
LSHKNALFHNKTSDFKIELNNIIEVEVNIAKKKIIFTNKTINCSAVEMPFV